MHAIRDTWLVLHNNLYFPRSTVFHLYSPHSSAVCIHPTKHVFVHRITLNLCKCTDLFLNSRKEKKTVSESWLEDIIWQEQSLIGALKQVITQNVSTHLGLGSYPRLKIENMSPAFRSLTSPTGKPAEVRWGQCNSKTGKKNTLKVCSAVGVRVGTMFNEWSCYYHFFSPFLCKPFPPQFSWGQGSY